MVADLLGWVTTRPENSENPSSMESLWEQQRRPNVEHSAALAEGTEADKS